MQIVYMSMWIICGYHVDKGKKLSIRAVDNVDKVMHNPDFQNLCR